MKKHIDIFIEGRVNKVDFNFYSQIGAIKFNIDAIYKNGDTRHVDIEAEGKTKDINDYIKYIRTGALKNYIELFRTEQGKFKNIQGFTSLKVHKEEITGFKRFLKAMVKY